MSDQNTMLIEAGHALMRLFAAQQAPVAHVHHVFQLQLLLPLTIYMVVRADMQFWMW